MFYNFYNNIVIYNSDSTKHIELIQLKSDSYDVPTTTHKYRNYEPTVRDSDSFGKLFRIPILSLSISEPLSGWFLIRPVILKFDASAAKYFSVYRKYYIIYGLYNIWFANPEIMPTHIEYRINTSQFPPSIAFLVAYNSVHQNIKASSIFSK